MRAPVERYDSPRHPFVEKHHVPGSLNDFDPLWDIHGSRNPGRKTVGCRIVVSSFGKPSASQFLDSPGLHGEFPARRINDETATARFFQSLVRARGFGFVEALQIRLSIRHAS